MVFLTCFRAAGAHYCFITGGWLGKGLGISSLASMPYMSDIS
jgi:hypothetical protein